MIRRTVSEWGQIAYGSAPDEIPEPAAVRLAAVARSSSLGGRDGSRILSLRRRDLRVGGIVGVAAVPGCSLEILPKIDGMNEEGVRGKLVHMLSIAADLPVSDNQTTQLQTQREDLLEMLIRVFAERTLEAVRRGMPRQYLEEQDELPALRGRLDIKRQFSVLAASPQKLACVYSALSPNFALNQIIKAAITHLIPFARLDATKRQLAELAFVYAEISDISPKLLKWDRVILDRTNTRWRDLLALARLLLDNLFQTTTNGTQAGVGLLFEMNTLFETYVARTLSQALRGQDFDVRPQGGRLFCLHDLAADKGRFQTKPDILVIRDGETSLIVDTKWKRLASAAEDPKLGVSQADVYQMMAYAQLYQSPRVVLLYPHHPGLDQGEGVMGRHRILKTDSELTVATVDLSNTSDFGRRLAEILFPSSPSCAA